MDTLVIKFDQDLQTKFLTYNFSYLVKEITQIMQSRYEVEFMLEDGKRNIVEAAMNNIYNKNITLKEIAEDFNIHEDILKENIEIVKLAVVNKIQFIEKYYFIIIEEDYLIWKIQLDYESIALVETNKFLNKLFNKSN